MCFLLYGPSVYHTQVDEAAELSGCVCVQRQGGNWYMDTEHRGVSVKRLSWWRNPGCPLPKSEGDGHKANQAQIGEDVELVKEIVLYFLSQLLVLRDR